jgi:hypothetical protein
MKVHFGGSGQGSQELYQSYIAIRDTIRELGYSIARDWLEPVVVKSTPSMENAYQKTVDAIKKSDAVVLEGTYDTSSVGKQLSTALELKLPVLILTYQSAKKDSSIDKFVSKDSANLIKKSFYTDKNIRKVLKDFFSWTEDKTKLVRFNLELERDLDNYLKAKAKKNNSSKAEEIRKLIQRDRASNSN